MTTCTGQWYKIREQGTRTGIWASCNAFAGVIGGGIAYGEWRASMSFVATVYSKEADGRVFGASGLAKADMNGSLAIPGWQVIFILLGSVTAGLGVVVFFFRESDTYDSMEYAEHSADSVRRLIQYRTLL